MEYKTVSKIAFVTDSNSGITQEQADELGIFVVPMPFTINGEEYFEGINLTTEEFYKMLENEAEIFTSQPTPETIMKMWEDILEDYDEIVHIPMSSGLSSSCSTAKVLAEEYDGRVQVVNNQRISVTQRESVIEGMELAKQGKNAKEIKEFLEKTKFDSSIYIMVDTLKYLKKGGRVTPAAAALGTLLRIKPVLQIRGEKLDAFAKARTVKQAKAIMMEAIEKDTQDGEYNLQIAHTQNEEAAMELKEELQKIYPNRKIYVDKLSLSVSCHIGPGALAIANTKKHSSDS
ncbi:MAG: DegV family protein [Lachnospiraceae bacterium]|nr:DegV family protein [Lachnospiraceae bacterium]